MVERFRALAFHSWDHEFASQSLYVDELEFGQIFLPILPDTNFIPPISPILLQTFRSYNFIHPVSGAARLV